jgi:hypothetical protein
MLFNFALGCVCRKVQENQVGLKLNEHISFRLNADDANLLGDDTETLIDASKEVGL